MVVVLCALGTALVNAVASFLQRLGVEDAPRTTTVGANATPRGTTSGGLIAHMLRRPVWVLGFACMGLGFVLQATALHSGSLAVVQPLLTTEMLFVVVLLWSWYGQHVRRRDWWFAACSVGGLATFLAVLAPSHAGHAPRNSVWFTAIGLVAAAMVALVAISRHGPAWWRALLLGAAASVGFAMTAALTKSFSDSITIGVGHALSNWQTYGLCVVGLVSFLLMQHAFHAGPFAASQSTLILVNPFVSVGLGAWLYGESFPRGAVVVAVGCLAVCVFVAGGVGLCTSPLIAGVHGTDDEVQLLAGKGRLARHLATRRIG